MQGVEEEDKFGDAERFEHGSGGGCEEVCKLCEDDTWILGGLVED